MNQISITLSQYALEHPTESVDVLMQAAGEIAASTEKDLDSIKSKKWYNRLLDIVTFSKENETVLATDIGSVAKLNTIVFNAVLLLANIDESNSELISQALNKIDNIEVALNQVAGSVGKVALELLNIKRGYKQSMTLSDLKPAEKEIFVNLFYHYAIALISNGYPPTEAAQNLYSFAVESVIPNSNPGDVSVDGLRPEVQQLLYRFEQAYHLLCVGQFDDSNHFDVFTISKKDCKKIRNQIEDAIQLCGEQNFCSALTRDSNVLIDDEDIVLIEAKESVEEEPTVDSEPQEITEYDIDHMLHETISTHIEKGTKRGYKHKHIHINKFISCEGQLVFDHCVIHYNESDEADEIKLSTDSEIVALDSIFICHGFDTHAFISGSGTAAFLRCSFYDCSFFVETVNSLVMLECLLANCGIGFVRDAEEYKIANLDIVFDKLAVFNELGIDTNSTGTNEPGKTISTTSSVFKFSHRTNSSFVKNVTAEYAEGAYKDDYNFTLFDLPGGLIDSSTFKNVTNGISCAFLVRQCLFENCTCPVSISPDTEKGCIVQSSCFDGCKDSITANVTPKSKPALIDQCRFINCSEQAIRENSGGSILTTFCEFVNYTNQHVEPCISVSCNKKSSASLIQNCLFDGVYLEDGFLIAAKTDEKLKQYAILVDDCDFRNCWTKRESGTIISTVVSLSKRIHVETVYVRNCRGLEKVHIGETGEKTKADIDTSISVDGKAVGSSVKKALKYAFMAKYLTPLTFVGGVILDHHLEKRKAEENRLKELYQNE